MQQTAPIQIQCVLQVNLLDVGIRRTAHADHVERGTVQMEGMAQIRLLYWNGKEPLAQLKIYHQNNLTFVNQHHLNDSVQRNVHLVGAHAIHAAIWWSIVAVAELLR